MGVERALTMVLNLTPAGPWTLMRQQSSGRSVWASLFFRRLGVCVTETFFIVTKTDPVLRVFLKSVASCVRKGSISSLPILVCLSVLPPWSWACFLLFALVVWEEKKKKSSLIFRHRANRARHKVPVPPSTLSCLKSLRKQQQQQWSASFCCLHFVL